MKKVAFVAGTAFCGSSLLNILLDTQAPAIRGLGEQTQVAGEGGGPCVVCKGMVDECQFYRQWNGKDFYEFNFNHYGCSTLIDSSKRTNMLLQGMAREPQFRYYVLHMSKTPHAAAYSIMKHWQHDYWDLPLSDAKRDIAGAFRVWIETNRLYIDELRGSNLEGRKPVHYDSLARNPSVVVEEICQWLGEPFNPERLQNWRSPTTHILGGNPAILMQVLGDFPTVLGREVVPDIYLDGKYAQKKGKIFTDEVWKGDECFLKSVIATYEQLSRELDPVLASLEYGDSGQMIGECKRILRENSSGLEADNRRGILMRVRDLLKVGKAA